MPRKRGRDRVSLLARLFPGVAVVRRYDRGWLRGDVLAGITVAAYLIPQVMAYAVVAGLPPVTGLWATLAPLAIYAVLGSSRRLSIGPESTTALMTAVAVGTLAGGDPGRYAALAAALALMVGGICLLGYLGSLGFLADLFSRPVLVGYMAGIAVLMIVSQWGKFTGINVRGDSPLSETAYALRHLGEANAATVLLAVSVLAFLLVMSKLLPHSPAPLLGMLIGAAAVAVFDLKDRGLTVVGAIPAKLPTPALPDVSMHDLSSLALPAIGLTLVAYSDNILTGRAFAEQGEQLDSNQEFLALGAANVGAGFFHGFPVSSSGSRTVIGVSMGSKSQVYSLVALAAIILTMLFFEPILAAFPNAALGAVVVFAALRLIDVPEMRRIARFRRSELAIALCTIVGVLVFGVLVGIGVAIGLSILDLLRRVARPRDGVLGYVPGVPGMHDVDDYPHAHQVPGLVVYRYDSPLFFANAQDFLKRALEVVEDAETPPEWFLLNAEANVEVDLTSVDALEQLRQTLADRGIELALARVKYETQTDLAAVGLTEKVGNERIFMTLPTAVEAYLRWYEDKHGSPPPGFPDVSR
ncbi:MAG: sulfate permease [Actinomycetota bacterium]|nr:sulfate permease [Actinomycetota bacterium]